MAKLARSFRAQPPENLVRNLPEYFLQLSSLLADHGDLRLKSALLLHIDEFDRRILQVLELDARRQNQEVAAIVGLSPSACLSRVRRLEANGVIRRYIADIDLCEFWLRLWVEIALAQRDASARKTIEAKITAAPEVVRAYNLLGRADYVLEILGPDPDVWPMLLARLDPEARLIAHAHVQICTRITKPFSGSPQLRPEQVRL